MVFAYLDLNALRSSHAKSRVGLQAADPLLQPVERLESPVCPVARLPSEGKIHQLTDISSPSVTLYRPRRHH